MSRLPFDLEGLTDELIRKAEIELGETSERRKTALAEMRAYIENDKMLYCPTEDHYLLQFLRPQKFDVKKAITLLQNYYHIKSTSTEVFGKKKYEYLVKVCRDKAVSLMPYRDEDGALILLIQGKYWNYNEMHFADIAHAVICIIIGLVDLHPATQICGIQVIIDAKDVTLQHLLHMHPKTMHTLAKAVTACAPVRLKAFHVINESVVVKYVWNIVRFVLSEKIKTRVHFHSTNQESLTKKINESLIPIEVGGTLNYDNSFWVKYVEMQEHKYTVILGYGYRSCN